MSESLFNSTAQCLNSLLGEFQALFEAVKIGNRTAVNYTTGMITKINEDTAQKLPLANKAAYRRFIMQKCLIVKETVKEFSEYIDKSRAQLSSKADTAADAADDDEEVSEGVEKLHLKADDQDDNDEDDDFDEDYANDMEEVLYDELELCLVGNALTIMNLGLEVLKETLNITTSVADRVAALHDNDLSGESGRWVCKMESYGQSIEGAVIDLGAELYPPLSSTDESLKEAYSSLKKTLIESIANLQSKMLIAYIEPNNLKKLDDLLISIETTSL